jgi:hypothetical protein
MDRKALKDFLYGGISELMKDHQYYYYSTVGGEYCRWTEEGQQALLELMDTISYKMLEAENEELNQRSKAIVLKTLKGE